jgi:hypothetical protein
MIANGAMASRERSISLRELYAVSTVAAVVEVLEVRVVAADGETCGARYKGRVMEGMKNATAGQPIEFGFAPSLKIGSKYDSRDEPAGPIGRNPGRPLGRTATQPWACTSTLIQCST